MEVQSQLENYLNEIKANLNKRENEIYNTPNKSTPIGKYDQGTNNSKSPTKSFNLGLKSKFCEIPMLTPPQMNLRMLKGTRNPSLDPDM
jgi:hypothetical protein